MAVALSSSSFKCFTYLLAVPRGIWEPSFPDQDQGWNPCFLQWKRSLNHWPTGEIPSSALDKGHWTCSCQRKGFGNASDLIQVSKTWSFEAVNLESGDQVVFLALQWTGRVTMGNTKRWYDVCLPTSGLCEHK